MTFKDKIKLVNDMIKENDNTTIADYQAAMTEIEGVENGSIVYEKEEEETRRQYILRLASEMTAKQIKMFTGHSFSVIYRALKDEGYDVHEARRQRREQIKLQQESDRQRALKARQLPKPYKAPDVRPPAQYSNSRPYDTLQTQQKTA